VTDNLWILFAAAGVMVAVIVTLSLLGDHYTLNNIKSKTVGDGQHGTARWHRNITAIMFPWWICVTLHARMATTC
jgi:hypothetical protein